MSSFSKLFNKAQDVSDPKRAKSLPTPGKGSQGSSSGQEGDKKKWIESPRFNEFKLGAILGTGSFGRVHFALHQPTTQICATKSLSKASILKTRQIEHVKQEKSILKDIDFPFIVNLLGSCQDSSCVHLVLEYVCGGEFFTYLRSTGRFDENTTRFYAAQVLVSFEYIHNMDIIYRDLKPENMLLDQDGNIKIADFGFAKKIDRRTFTLCGTPDYLAPELILNKGHGKPVDWWAFGVLVFEMLAGYPPFYDDDPAQTYKKILAGRVNFPGHFSRSAKDLIRQLLVADLTKRIGCLKDGVKDLKNHSWFNGTDWDAVVRKKDPPPIRPKVAGADDTSCFDDYSKMEPMKHEFVLSSTDQKQFEDL
ncbi:unnamed protein product [Calypogeia fissa]